MTDTSRFRYGWTSTAPTSAHAYLVPAVEQLLRAWFPLRARIVDLGCGNGRITAHLAAMGHDVVGIDASSDGIEIARRAYPSVPFRLASVDDSELPDLTQGSIDCVVSLEVIEHLYYPRKLFEQGARLLKPGGRLLVSTPYHGYLKNLAISVRGGWDRHFTAGWDGGHIKFFSPKTLMELIRDAGFTDLAWSGAGRLPLLWKSMIVTATRV